MLDSGWRIKERFKAKGSRLKVKVSKENIQCPREIKLLNMTLAIDVQSILPLEPLDPRPLS